MSTALESAANRQIHLPPLFSCPVCASSGVTQVLPEITITATIESGETQVHGLAAFECPENHHLFFVRVSDLD